MPSFISFCQVVSEEKTFEKVYDDRRRRTQSDDNSSRDLRSGELKSPTNSKQEAHKSLNRSPDLSPIHMRNIAIQFSIPCFPYKPKTVEIWVNVIINEKMSAILKMVAPKIFSSLP